MELLKTDPPLENTSSKNSRRPNRRAAGHDQWNENADATEQTMNFDNNDNLENDIFAQRMFEWMD